MTYFPPKIDRHLNDIYSILYTQKYQKFEKLLFYLFYKYYKLLELNSVENYNEFSQFCNIFVGHFLFNNFIS